MLPPPSSPASLLPNLSPQPWASRASRMSGRGPATAGGFLLVGKQHRYPQGPPAGWGWGHLVCCWMSEPEGAQEDRLVLYTCSVTHLGSLPP